jgi:hypothetical protein
VPRLAGFLSIGDAIGTKTCAGNGQREKAGFAWAAERHRARRERHPADAILRKSTILLVAYYTTPSSGVKPSLHAIQ